jgi:hypothetical protein
MRNGQICKQNKGSQNKATVRQVSVRQVVALVTYKGIILQ